MGIELLLLSGLLLRPGYSQETLPVPVAYCPLPAQAGAAAAAIAALRPAAQDLTLPTPTIPKAFQVAAAAKPAVRPAAKSRKAAMGELQALGGELASDQALGGGDQGGISRRFFENGAEEAGVAPEIPLPQGVKRASFEYASKPSDVKRLIPAGKNSMALASFLKNNVRRIGPVGVVTYVDGIGRVFAAIDLNSMAAPLRAFPGLEAGDAAIIENLRERARSVQVLVDEDEKTPRLVVDGVVTDVRSSGGSIHSLLSKADSAVASFNSRHMISGGAAAVLASDGDVESEVRTWAAGRKNVHLDRIWVLRDGGLMSLKRGTDGAFRLDASAAEASRPGAEQVPEVQLLLKQGRLDEARRRLSLHEKSAPDDPHSPASQAREKLEARRMLLALRKLSGDPVAAQSIWENFRKTHSPEIVLSVEGEARKLLTPLKLPKNRKIAGGDNLASRLVRQVTAPIEILKRAGIEFTVAVYGSARILSREKALENFRLVVSEVGRGPWTAEQRERVLAARKEVSKSRAYEMARRFGALVVKGTGGKVAIVTGGGGGDMEGANRGAFEAGGKSVGFNIHLEKEQKLNPYVTPGLAFEFEDFGPRKMALRLGALAHVHFKGGFGTFDELFETLTLMQNGKIPHAPIILVGAKNYWKKVINFDVFVEEGLISPKDMDLFHFVENEEQAWAIVRAAYGN